MVKERNRQRTEEKLIDTIGVMIAESGFEQLGVNQVANRAGLSKSLIYRYFESLDRLIYAYMKKHNFWTHAHDEMPKVSDIRLFLKDFYRRQISGLRGNVALRRLKRWEFSAEKDFLAQVRAEREKNAIRFTEMMRAFVKVGDEQLQAVAAILDAAIIYIVLFEDNCRMYNGIDIQSDQGWEQITNGIDLIIDAVLKIKG